MRLISSIIIRLLFHCLSYKNSDTGQRTSRGTSNNTSGIRTSIVGAEDNVSVVSDVVKHFTVVFLFAFFVINLSS